MPDPPHMKAHEHPFRRAGAGAREGEAAGQGARGSAKSGAVPYVELAVTSNFTFLRGASHPEELVQRAAALGHEAAAVTDWNSLAGVVRAHVAAKEAGIHLAVGCRLVFADTDAFALLVYPTDRASYGRLCRLLTLGKRRAAKGECHITVSDLLEHQEGLLGVVLGGSHEERRHGGTKALGGSHEATKPRSHEGKWREGILTPARNDPVERTLRALREALGDDRLSLAVARPHGSDDARRVAEARALSAQLGIPLAAVNDVYCHVPARRVLQDVLTCVRHGCTLADAGFRLFANGERHLKSPQEMARLFADMPEAVARSAAIAARTRGFSLDQLRYEYPEETCPPGVRPMDHLKRLTWEGAAERYPGGVPEKVRGQIEYEFALIEELQYATYFLTVHDLVKFARSREILCQGRGAAANSAVCFCLGVTAVDPDRIDVLFERFVSRERNEPPDIDIDFEHERREEVIQYIYEKYGRERAGLTAEVITYRRRSAIRDVGKALGFSLDAVDRIAKRVDTWEKNPFADSESGDVPAQLTALGFDARDATVRRFVALVRELVGFPRHLSQHVGGFVMTRGPLCELVPIENAAMEKRTVIEWNKDDIEAMGMLKVDVLGLGMLTCIRKALELIKRHEGTKARRHEESRHEGKEEGHEESRSGEKGHEPTEARRHEEDKSAGEQLQGNGREGEYWDDHQNISGSDCLAEGNEFGEGPLRINRIHAGYGAIRTNHADATSDGFCAQQYCGRVCATESNRLSAVPEVGTRFTGGAGNHDDLVQPVGISSLAGNGLGTPARDGSSATGAYSEFTTLEKGDVTESHEGTKARSHEGNGELQHTNGIWPNIGANIKGRIDTSGIAFPNTLPSSGLSSPSCLRAFVPSSLSLATIPAEDPHVYDMICRADTLGVFQIESRAQMTMLPRLQPRCFYDLVIEVAIVRPGPIVGEMVHPYLRRRNGEEAVEYPDAIIRQVLGKTLGVPLFQEQVMALAIKAAGFTPGEAERLRRAITAWTAKEDIARFPTRFVEGMVQNGYAREFAEWCFQRFKGFSQYGFPESHAASFALLVYASCWIKCYYPAVYAAALLNSQPMGFYAPAQIVRDARDHGVEVRAVDVNASAWDCTLEEGTKARRHEGTKEIVKYELRNAKKESDSSANSGKGFPQIAGAGKDSRTSEKQGEGAGLALRLGMRMVRGLREEEAQAIVTAVRQFGAFASPMELWRRSGVSTVTLQCLARADAFASMGLDRRRALWEVQRLHGRALPLFDMLPLPEESTRIAPAPAVVSVGQDYQMVGLSLKAHPVSFLREQLSRKGVWTASQVKDAARAPAGRWVKVAGIALFRQRPGTAKGVMFMTIEDETGRADLIVRPQIYERDRSAAVYANLVLARGRVERQGLVVHVLVHRLEDIENMTIELPHLSRDFR